MNEVPSPDELEKYQRTIDTLLHQTNTSDVMRRLFSLTIQLLERHFVIAPYNREDHASFVLIQSLRDHRNMAEVDVIGGLIQDQQCWFLEHEPRKAEKPFLTF